MDNWAEHTYGDFPDKTKPRSNTMSLPQRNTDRHCSWAWLQHALAMDNRLLVLSALLEHPLVEATNCPGYSLLHHIQKSQTENKKQTKFMAFKEKEIYHEPEHEVLQHC